MKIKITLLLTLLLLVQACQAQDLSDNHITVKILSFNIYHGATTQGDYNLDAIARVIIDADPELVKPEPTFPSDDPRIKIDYVMHFPTERWETIETKVICDSIASDHCAHLVTLKLLSKN